MNCKKKYQIQKFIVRCYSMKFICIITNEFNTNHTGKETAENKYISFILSSIRYSSIFSRF